MPLAPPSRHATCDFTKSKDMALLLLDGRCMENLSVRIILIKIFVKLISLIVKPLAYLLNIAHSQKLLCELTAFLYFVKILVSNSLFVF